MEGMGRVGETNAEEVAVCSGGVKGRGCVGVLPKSTT